MISITFNGQNGNDLLDLNDTGDAADTDTYTIGTSTFAKSSSTFTSVTFSGTERVDLLGNGGANTIEIDGILAGMNVTLNGGGGDDLFVNPDLNMNSTILGTVTLNGGSGTDTVTLSDENDFTATEYTLTDTTFQVTGGPLSGVVHYNNDETFNFLANGFDSSINVDSTKSTVAYELRGNAGEDDFNFTESARNVDALLGDVTVIGGPDFDTVNLYDDNNLALSSYYALKTELYRVGTAKVKPTVESILISAGDGNSSIHVDGVASGTPLIVTGGEGSNGFFVGNGNWDTNILNQVLVVGGSATDTISIDDTTDTGGDVYSITNNVVSKLVVPAAQILYAAIEGITLDANVTGNTINVTSTSGSVLLNGHGGSDSFNILDAAAGSTVQIDGGTQLDNVNVNTDGAGVVQAVLIGSQDLDNVHVFPGGSIQTQAGGANLLYLRNLTVDANATLDLNDNDMIYDYSSLSPRTTVAGYISTARNAGAWNGATGITSSNAKNASPKNTTLGVLEASEFKAIHGVDALFSGQAIDATSVLVKYTYYGDTDFSGDVDFDDYSRIDSGFNLGRTGWLNGDVDNNGVVDFDDYSLIDQAFNTQGSALRPALPPIGGKPGGRGAAL